MQILLLGATGRTGSLVLQEALQRSHNVTALVRDPSALANLPAAQHHKSNLTLIRGSPLNPSDVATAVAAASNNNGGSSKNNKIPLVVISTLNPRRASESPWAAAHPTDSPPRMMADSIANILAALSNNNNNNNNLRGGEGGGADAAAKVVHLAAVGVGSSAAQTPWAVRALVACSNMKLTYADHEAVEAELREAEGSVAWVSVRANRLVEKGGEEKEGGAVAKVWPAEKGSVGLMATSSREAVAKFLVDAAERKDWDRTAPIIVG